MDVIYKITSPNGKVYIGRTNNFNQRMIEHKYAAYTKKLKNSLYKAIRKYGWDNMIKEVILEVEPEKAQKIEEELILLNNSVRKGYNDTYVGGGGDQWEGRRDTDDYMEFLHKMKLVNSSNRMHGKSHTKETKTKQKEKAKGRFSLPWFIERHGEEKGKELYNKRCQDLSNRPKLKGDGNPMRNPEVIAKRKQR
jgi:group I intron endonuclease